MCPVCPAAGVFGGYLGGYFGINVPKDPNVRLACGVITAGLLVTTIVALKFFLGFSFCVDGGAFTVHNFVRVGIVALAIGIIYSIAVNYIMGLIFPDSEDAAPAMPSAGGANHPISQEAIHSIQTTPSCCCGAE